MIRTIIISFFLFIILPCKAAQDSTAYSREFVFKEGIYLSYWQFRHNSPVEVKKIISDYDKTKLDYLTYVTGRKEITYLNDSNEKITVKPSEIWGYCQNQAIYIAHSGDFFRISVMGNICHFLGYQYVTMGFNNPGFYGYPQNYPATVREQTQFIVDNETGRIMLFNVDVMENILSRDEVLYREFMALKNKKKRQSVFLYLRKYNEKHPLYFYTPDR